MSTNRLESTNLAALPDAYAQTQSQSDPDIALITADSRQVIPGALFVAYPGVSVDGHNFLASALERGVPLYAPIYRATFSSRITR